MPITNMYLDELGVQASLTTYQADFLGSYLNWFITRARLKISPPPL